MAITFSMIRWGEVILLLPKKLPILLPHSYKSPFFDTAIVWLSPAATADTSCMIKTGLDLFMVEP